jgi:hypothetical protein
MLRREKGQLVRMDEALANVMLRDSGVGRTDEDYVTMVEGLFPAHHNFDITSVPEGEAPYRVREQWVGTSLPLRTELVKYQPVLILAVDGLVALKKSGRDDAHDWWQDYYAAADKPINIPMLINPFAHRPGMMARLSFLGFQPDEGTIEKISKKRS